MITTHESRPRWLTAKRLCQENPHFSISTLRWWLYCRSENGLQDTTRKIGGRLYINEGAFFDWFDSHKTEDAGRD